MMDRTGRVVVAKGRCERRMTRPRIVQEIAPPMPKFVLPLLLASALALPVAAGASDSQAQPAAAAARSAEISPMRWRLRHGRELSGTIPLLHSETPGALPQGRAVRLDGVRFDWPNGAHRTFEDYRAGNVLDGFLVMKDGKVVFEQYYDGFGPRGTHNWASMSKSVVGVVALRLAAAGKIDLAAPLSRYVPELGETPFGKASVRDNLDMRVSVAYPPDLPPDLGLFAAVGLIPAKPGAPASIHDFLRAALPGAVPNGSQFYYQNGSTEAVGWALERASGKPLAQLVTENIWTPIGAADDGYYLVDRQRSVFASGGLSSTLRDLARFGEYVRTLDKRGEGAIAQSVLAWEGVRDAPGHDFHYGSFWWHGKRGAYALGRYGQRLAIIPDKGIVIAQFGAYEDDRPRAVAGSESATNVAADMRDGEAFQALAVAIADQVSF